MNTKIEYRWETKEEQRQHWKEYEEWMEERHSSHMESYLEHKNGKCKKSDFYYVINSFELAMWNYILVGRIDYAETMARTGLKLLENNEDVETEYLHLLLRFDWFINKKENVDYVREHFTYVDNFITTTTDKLNATSYIYATMLAIRCGEFQKAKLHIRNAYEIKTQSRLNTNVIYHLERFYAFIAEYLFDKEKNSDMLPKLKECFKNLFDEVQKGNTKIVNPYVINPALREIIINLRYIWYKYFSGRDWETISLIEIIQSERYGIKGLQNC